MTARSPQQERETTTGWRKILSRPGIYDAVQWILGTEDGWRIFLDEYIQARPGMRVLDVGCGPARLLASLPDVDYCGIDHSERYIEAARQRYGDRGRFLVQDAADMVGKVGEGYDLVVCMGVLHHLDDVQVESLMRTVAQLVKQDGRIVTVDPAYTARQNPLARLAISMDRGRHVRDAEHYAALARPWLERVALTVRTDMMRIPYTHALMVCGTSKAL